MTFSTERDIKTNKKQKIPGGQSKPFYPKPYLEKSLRKIQSWLQKWQMVYKIFQLVLPGTSKLSRKNLTEPQAKFSTIIRVKQNSEMGQTNFSIAHKKIESVWKNQNKNRNSVIHMPQKPLKRTHGCTPIKVKSMTWLHLIKLESAAHSSTLLLQCKSKRN